MTRTGDDRNGVALVPVLAVDWAAWRRPVMNGPVRNWLLMGVRSRMGNGHATRNHSAWRQQRGAG
jgi:hypothetical protein